MGELEQAVLEALWSHDGSATGREVLDRLADRDLAYTTVMTVLDRLVGKELVDREREGRAFRYAPRRTRAEMTAEVMHEALAGTGADRGQALVSFVGEASPEDLEALRRALADLG